MSTLPEIIPVSDLRQDAAATLKKLEGSDDPIIITQRGRAAAVLMNVGAYERAEEERRMLLALAKGEQQIRNNQLVDLDDVMAKADAMLTEGSE